MKISRKLAYSFGAVAVALSSQAFSTYIIFFYVDVMRLSAHLAAVAMIIYGLWNAVNDPIFGYLSDHTRTRWGRRIPYIALGAIPFGIIYLLLWVPPFSDVSHVYFLFLYFVVFICLFDGLYTLTSLNWLALFPEMFPGLAERSQVNAFRQTFVMLGLVVGIAIPPLIYGSLGWGWMGAIFGATISLSFLVSLLGSREKKIFSREKQLPLLPSLKYTLKNRSFLPFVFSNLFVQYTFTIILAAMPFYAKYVLDVGAQETTAILLAAFLTAIPMLYVWGRLTQKFGAKNCFMATMALLGVSLVPLFFVKTFWGAFTASALMGIGIAGFLLIVDLLISDIIDEDETRTGTRREGIYFGINSFITRFAIGLEAFSLGMVFLFSNYNPYVYTQPIEFLSGLRFLIAGLPLIALALAIASIWFYPLHGGRLEEVKAKVAEIHAGKGL
jgi:GPH family glycoside/pentoside/hexuronide:cation symporter